VIRRFLPVFEFVYLIVVVVFVISRGGEYALVTFGSAIILWLSFRAVNTENPTLLRLWWNLTRGKHGRKWPRNPG
jgi:hypothetical protein